MVFVERFAEWLRKPYSDDMNVGGWFAFLGLIFLLTMAWAGIVRKLTD